MRAKNHLDASWYANAPIIIAEGGGFKLTPREPDDPPVPSRAFNCCGLMKPQSGAKLHRNEVEERRFFRSVGFRCRHHARHGQSKWGLRQRRSKQRQELRARGEIR